MPVYRYVSMHVFMGMYVTDMIFSAGMFTQDPRERNCILDMLDTRRNRTGWPVNPLGEELRQLWLKTSFPGSEVNSPV